MKRIFTVLFCLFIIIGCAPHQALSLSASEGNFDNYIFAEAEQIVYRIVDEEGNEISQRTEVARGDQIITKDFDIYTIVRIDKENKIAHAKKVERMKRPRVRRERNGGKPKQISNVNSGRIGLYCTHSAESFVVGDGTDSIWGAGGIYDVARLLKSKLQERKAGVVLDETLHIPHDSGAYGRSLPTAQKLLNNYNPDALFDIHRDGVARSNYVKKVNGEERSQIMIVVGKSNPNKDANLQFALYLLSVGNELYPWLFKEIYFASGHYNQALYSKALLFECGTHLLEKNIVLESVEPLADVIATTLYGTAVEEETGDLVIGGDVIEENNINSILDSELPPNDDKPSAVRLSVVVKVIIGIMEHVRQNIEYINENFLIS